MTPEPAFDAVILGSGPAGRGCARGLSEAGLRVAMVESELVGGECPFWACIPSKTLLRPAEVVSEARHAAGLSRPSWRWEDIRAYRDYMNSDLDDGAKFDQYSKEGIEIVRGWGRIVDPRTVEVDGRRLATARIVIATGSVPALPDVPGLDQVDFWTNRQATALNEVPGSTVVLGGGPVGLELGQMLSRYGSQVTIVEAADRLLAREDPRVGQRLGRLLGAEGIQIRVGVGVARVERPADGSAPGVRVHLQDGGSLDAERLLVATGRRPRADDLGLENLSVAHGEGGIRVDSRCRVTPGVWAIGDVTGVAPFTHVAAYQARVAVRDILGQEVQADYRAVPRVVFTDPEVAGVGLTAAQAAEQGIRTSEAVLELSEVDRLLTYGRDLEGEVGVVADASRSVLVGAWAIGPLASEWIHAAVLAVKAEVPLAVLRDTMMQFPTFSEGLQMAAARL
ncbi:MAG TPA: NAD(P)/FAD-dependent oxidoreductase [Solirubrobacteraceae bacterium]|nr:NAD(P)/FAD-dependent oxidoreductase [Solirubrobacteraceae bacterium]